MKRVADQKLYSKIRAIIRHDYFFYAILGIVSVQAIWYALSFLPILFDETRHMGFIQAYTQYLTPFISAQSPSFDALGEMTRDPSYLFYYIMSWPLRLISVFTDSFAIQLIFLRLISLSFVITGLIYFRKAFLLAGVPKTIAHLTLLFFMLIPTIALFPGAIHYDNAIFMLFAMCLVLGIKILKDAQPSAQKLLLLAILGMLGTLVKFTFIALFMPIALFIVYDQWKKHGSNWLPKARRSFSSLQKPTKIALVGIFLLSSLLFIERPVQNIIVYRQIQPDCQKLMDKDRCLKNYTAKRNIELLDKRPEGFKPLDPFRFSLVLWTDNMISTQISFVPSKPPVPILLYLFYGFALGGILLLFAYIRDYLKHPAYRFLLFACVGYVAFLFLYLFIEYAKYAQPVALSGRYLFQVQPIFMLFVALALARLLQNTPKVRLSILAAVILIFTQGGGMTSMLISSDHTHYWNKAVYSATKPVQDAAKALIFEKTPFQN